MTVLQSSFVAASTGKVCTTCGEYKLYKYYSKKANAKDGLEYRCKECKSKSDRIFNLARRYNITPQEYNDMLQKQKGKCTICGQPETAMRFGKVVLLSVDHCHQAGRIRGLLCSKCNLVIGNADDDISVLQSAIYYLMPETSPLPEFYTW